MALILAAAPGASSWQPVGFGSRPAPFVSERVLPVRASVDFHWRTAPPDPSPAGYQLAGRRYWPEISESQDIF